MLAHFVPNAINVSDLVFKQKFIAQPKHDLLNLCVRGRHKNATPLLYFVLALVEVVVELVNKFVTLIDSCNVSLPSAISLGFNHDAALLGCDHLHLEARAFNLGLIRLG